MENSLYETRLQGIMVFVFMKTNFLLKMRNATTMIPCRHTSLWDIPAGSHCGIVSSKQISGSRWWIQLPCFPAGTSHYTTRLQGTMVVIFIKNKYPDQDDEYNYHDSLQAHLTIRHACRESWLLCSLKQISSSRRWIQLVWFAAGTPHRGNWPLVLLSKVMTNKY